MALTISAGSRVSSLILVLSFQGEPGFLGPQGEPGLPGLPGLKVMTRQGSGGVIAWWVGGVGFVLESAFGTNLNLFAHTHKKNIFL